MPVGRRGCLRIRKRSGTWAPGLLALLYLLSLHGFRPSSATCTYAERISLVHLTRRPHSCFFRIFFHHLAPFWKTCRSCPSLNDLVCRLVDAGRHNSSAMDARACPNPFLVAVGSPRAHGFTHGSCAGNIYLDSRWDAGSPRSPARPNRTLEIAVRLDSATRLLAARLGLFRPLLSA